MEGMCPMNPLLLAVLAICLVLSLSAAESGPTPGSAADVAKGAGIVNVPSEHSVDQTVDRLMSILKSRGIMLFALIDHSGEAEKVGMKMPPTKLLIFGSPKAGTPVMLAAPSIALDLPLKILVWQDKNGKAWLSYNSPTYLQERHDVPADLLPNLAVVEKLAADAAK